jgi:endoglucanase
MKKQIISAITLAVTCIIFLCVNTQTSTAITHPNTAFIKTQGDQLIVNNEAITLRGINFNNYHWYATGEEMITSNHHSEEDYAKVQNMGMNVIRFQLNYKIFEDDDNPWVYKQEAFDWLDQNIAWAKEHDIYLILDMHVPPGGQQSGLPEGVALWEETQNQYRLAGIWHAIAERYSDEPTIAGFSLLNEPVPVENIDDWNALATYITSRIREVDQNHMIVFEWPLGLYEQFESYNDRDLVQSLLSDDNVLYDMHFYHPFEFTHQHISWMGTGDGGSYPDETLVSLPPDLSWSDATLSNPVTPEGYSSWTYYEGELKQNTDDTNILAVPALVSGSQNGLIFFKQLVIAEYDEQKQLIREIPVTFESPDTWEKWNSEGDATFHVTDKNDENILSIRRTPAQSIWYDMNQYVELQKNNYYSIGGWMKGKRIEEYGYGQIRLDFYASPSQTEIAKRDKQDIENTLLYWTQFARDNNVPLFIGEFGTHASTFKDQKGGLTWVTDIVDIFEKQNLHYTYHDYHSYNAFGLYTNPIGLPDETTANTSLIDFFTAFFASL